MDKYKGEIAKNQITFNVTIHSLMSDGGAYCDMKLPYCVINGNPDGYPDGYPIEGGADRFKEIPMIDTRIPIEDRKRIWSGEWENMSYKQYLRYVK